MEEDAGSIQLVVEDILSESQLAQLAQIDIEIAEWEREGDFRHSVLNQD
jgi:hypothetical protein